ncbi:MAG: hypothetical protein H7230_01930 [Candidatus Parcubacteria bacterium]|nr:hypothetical protein [Candidatus Paceibacterota bacterium]
MALKNISKLSKRRQGELIGQIYKYIYLYNDFFIPRTRVYLKEIAQLSDTIYWLEHPKTSEVTSLAIIDPRYNFNLENLDWVVIGHTISKIPNQIHNILDHIMGDYSNSNIILLSRELFANAMQLNENYKFVCMRPADLIEHWPDLANMNTDYFNLVSGESMASGCSRKGYNVYVRVNDTHKAEIKVSNPKLSEFLSTATE